MRLGSLQGIYGDWRHQPHRRDCTARAPSSILFLWSKWQETAVPRGKDFQGIVHCTINIQYCTLCNVQCRREAATTIAASYTTVLITTCQEYLIRIHYEHHGPPPAKTGSLHSQQHIAPLRLHIAPCTTSAYCTNTTAYCTPTASFCTTTAAYCYPHLHIALLVNRAAFSILKATYCTLKMHIAYPQLNNAAVRLHVASQPPDIAPLQLACLKLHIAPLPMNMHP